MRVLKFRWLAMVALLVAAAGITRASHPLPPINLVQNNSNNVALPQGASTAGSSNPLTVILSASSDPSTCDEFCIYYLAVEVVPVGQPFQNVPTAFVVVYGKPNCEEMPYPGITINNLTPNTAYKWQCQEITDCTGGKASLASLPTPNGGGGISFGPWVQFNGGGMAFQTPPHNTKFVIGYTPATDQGRGQVFFLDKNPLPFAQSWKIEVRRVDQTSKVIHSAIINRPGGPPPGDVAGNSQFDLPRVDAFNPLSFEIDMMTRVRVYSGLDGTGAELYFANFLYIIHPSASTLGPFVFGGPTQSGSQLVPCADLRPTGQDLACKYSLTQKLVPGPISQLNSVGHGIPGAFPTKFVHPPTIFSILGDVQPGDSIIYLRQRRIYGLTNGATLGYFDVAPKSPNVTLNDLPAPAP